MKEQKIDFIVAYNNERFFSECRFYIAQLIVPEGYEVGIIGIVDGKSMTSAYNEGMNASEAKYKVYLHQDLFILNKNFIHDILVAFQNDSSIGMMGILGGINLPDNGVYYNAWNVGQLKADNGFRTLEVKIDPPEPYFSVEAIDGMIMITQYDLPWREDLFQGWDYYDISQSFEFRRKGYRVVVPRQTESWCLHDCGYSRLADYDRNRRIFCREYLNQEEAAMSPMDIVTDQEQERRLDDISSRLFRLIDSGAWRGVIEVVRGFERKNINRTELRILKCICEIYDMEINDPEKNDKGQGYTLFIDHGNSWREAYDWYKEITFLARRIEQGYTGENQVGELIAAFRNRKISQWALLAISKWTMFDWEKMVVFLQHLMVENDW